MKPRTIDIITLGCSKNLVDSEKLIRQLELNGFEVTHDAEEPEGEIAIVNTCGFIGDAKEESINMILELAQRKAQGKIKQLIVMGCLSQRYFEELKQELPEVDRFYGKFDWEQIITDIITGKQKSHSIEEIVAEVEGLVAKGVKEFQVIAQELTGYGTDLYGKQMIAPLIERIAEVPGVEWIRLHYGYPAHFPWELLEVMKRHENVCKYLDIALQHISDNQLSAMRRHITKQETYDFIEKIRKEVPDIHLRTTLMVGFPGETDEDFQELIDFVKWAKFERMGAFAYSEEEGTYAAEHYKDDVPEEVKQVRLSKLMRVQQQISEDVQARKVGRTMKVIIDREEGDYFIGRTEYDSPEVDPEVLIKKSKSSDLRPGFFYAVNISSADEFDLFAKVE